MSNEIVTNKEEKLEMPEKPNWAIGTALKWGAIAAAVYTGIVALGTLIGRKVTWPARLHKMHMETDIVKELPYNAAAGSAIGIIVGLTAGIRENATYPLKVENITLKDRIAKLEKTGSYAQDAAAEKDQKKLESPAK